MNDQTSENINRQRLRSLDVLRGVDMFWIIGGGALIRVLAIETDTGWLDHLAVQFRHVPWEGFRFYDLIFPLFMFISGAVIPYSVLSKLEKGARKNRLILKTSRRVLLLIALGIVYNGVLKDGFSSARYVSILGQIGIAYFFAALIVLFSGSQVKRLLWLIAILAGIAFLQLFVPVPGYGAGVLTPEGHINGYIDRLLLPGRLAYGPGGMTSGQGIYDALGLLSTVSSVGITLMGVFAGSVLRSYPASGMRKTGILAATGAGLILISIILNPFYPIIKNCWTSTYTLLAGGISFVLVAFFYLVIDVWGIKRWTFFFRVIGLNPLFIYLFWRLVNIRHTTNWLFGWLTNGLNEGIAIVILASGDILLVWALLYFMYKNRIYIKI